ASLSRSRVLERAHTHSTFTHTLSLPDALPISIHTSQGDITVADGATTGQLTIASGNGEDVYQDGSSLTATITGTSGGNFEHLVRSEEHTSELQSLAYLVCRLLLDN